MSGVNEIRRKFLDYFAAPRPRGGAVVAARAAQRPDLDVHQCRAWCSSRTSSPASRSAPIRSAATAQKCVRAGGKHNDLDNVGYTARHHTFFEMLGNFSFGDYFKDRAIELAWNLITKEFGLPKDRLIVTVYVDDDEAFELWKKIAGPAGREDHPHRRLRQFLGRWATPAPAARARKSSTTTAPHIPGGPPGSPDADGDRFIEIWNLVFMQYEQLAGGKRVDLPKPSIDTGMGLERIAAVLQGTHDNYEIDLFRAIIGQVADLTGVDPDGPQKASHRVIADHLRASSFLIADGVLPSNEGRGYVLRRIMRRAMRHAELLGAREPLMCKLVPTLTREMGAGLSGADPRRGADRRDAQARRDAASARPWSAGLRSSTRRRKGLKKGDRLKGETAFTLYDTYGFPLDLTQDALRARGIEVDIDAFNAAMEQQREKARESWKGSGDAATEAVWFALREKLGATEFLGYETETAEGVVAALVQGRQGGRVARQGRERRGRRQPDAVLRRIRRPGRRHRRDDRRRRALPRHRHAEEGRRSLRPHRHGGGGHAQARRGARARGRSCAPQRHPPEPFRHASAARGAAPGARRSRRAEGLAGRARPAALRLLASEADDGRGDREGRGHRQRLRAAELAGDHAADGARRRARVRRPRAVRREIRRRGARRRHGRGLAATPWAGRSSCAAARMCGAPAISASSPALSDSGVAAGVRRIEALTGAAARKAARHLGELAKTAAAELKAPLEELPGTHRAAHG